MELLKQRILADGAVRPGNILKVDSFLNNQLDVALLDRMGEAFFEHFKAQNITRILTVEAIGIAIAMAAGRFFGVPVVFAKKSQSKNLDGELYTAPVKSFTHGTINTIVVEKRFLTGADRVLIVDDFLATGNAQRGLLALCSQAGASVAGIGIAIEKGFQGGGDALRREGYDVYSLAIVEKMTDDSLTFRT